jgi:rfaE bifunctional protein kinase chain/domain
MKGIVMKELNNIRILVVGDIMLDKYVIGTVDRISPEAPVPVVNVMKEYFTLGGCGNVVRNIREMGATVDCLASIGPDQYGNDIIQRLMELDIGRFIFTGSTETTVKERIVADDRKIQLLRVDREDVKDIDPSLAIDVFERIADKKEYDIIVVSDYAKGMITSNLMSYLRGKKVKIIVDPKPQHVQYYNNVFMVTPNEKEWRQMRFSSNYNLSNVNYILNTKGSKGMELIHNKKDTLEHIPADPVEVYNVSGAGDVVVASMAVCLSLGIDVLTSTKIATKAASYSVTQPQTCVVPREKFNSILKCFNIQVS